MKVNNSNNAEQILQFQLMTQIFKEASGDSDSFELIMESLLNSVQDTGDSSSIDLSSLGLSEEDLSNLGYSGGNRLDELKSYVNSGVTTDNLSIEEAVDKASNKYGVDKSLIMAVIKQESDFNPNSISGAGAEGLMQLMPQTASEQGVSNPFDISQNVDGGTKYLKKLLDMYGNSKELALAAYNAGPGTVQNRGVSSVSDISKLPYETRDYVNKVMKYYGK